MLFVLFVQVHLFVFCQGVCIIRIQNLTTGQAFLCHSFKKSLPVYMHSGYCVCGHWSVSLYHIFTMMFCDKSFQPYHLSQRCYCTIFFFFVLLILDLCYVRCSICLRNVAGYLKSSLSEIRANPFFFLCICLLSSHHALSSPPPLCLPSVSGLTILNERTAQCQSALGKLQRGRKAKPSMRLSTCLIHTKERALKHKSLLVSIMSRMTRLPWWQNTPKPRLWS